MPATPQPPPPDAPAAERLGFVLRLRRQAMPGIRNREQLAERLGYSVGVVKAVENGVYKAGLHRYMTRWEQVIGLDPELHALWDELRAEQAWRRQPSPPATQGLPIDRFNSHTGRNVQLVAPDCESWVDDLDRAHAYLNKGDFRTTGMILERWLTPYPPATLDDRGRYLRGRTLMLRGNVLRSQGFLTGPLSARQTYDEAADLFHHLDNPRRLAQVELDRAITIEMSGDLYESARRYRRLAEDERLGVYERAQARLWIGTALTKAGEAESAAAEIEHASRMFEQQGEPDDWGVAKQKRALAYLVSGDLVNATRSIEAAVSHGRHTDSFFEQVRLNTALGHVLVTDRHTAEAGLAVLAQAREQAIWYGLANQLQWIRRIQRIGAGSRAVK